jgi:tRNA A37 threonylcarbamoyladenosine synthetase subunit TsaC/SUA5/YrdC
VTAYLKGKNSTGKPVAVRMPRNKFKLDIIDELNVPLYYASIHNAKGKQIFMEKNILTEYMGKVGLIVVIQEFCKDHPFTTVVDLTKNELHVILEGRIPEEELKSLYFLGKDDVFE